MISDDRTFDGIICFGGEDWWYHNRGHYDMQMMRELSRDMPVLYVNSIGMRVPRLGEGSMFFTRVRRKWKSLRRGLVQVRENFAVFTPLAIPGRIGRAVGDAILASQVRAAATRLGIRRPLVWVACPPAARVIDRLDAPFLLYQRTDRLEHFEGVDYHEIAGYDRALKKRADLTVFCSGMVHREERADCRASAYIDHGVDFERFRDAGDAANVPDDVRGVPGPRVIFVGGIDRHTFWPEMFVEVARELPDLSIVLVGSCSLPDDWCAAAPNVTLLGQRPYEAVPDYMAAGDVLIMPWNRSAWIDACNPVKLKEYLAVGRPIVSTPFAELERYGGLVRVAEDAPTFAAEIRAALREHCDVTAMRTRVERESWTAKADTVLGSLAADGILPAPRSDRSFAPAREDAA